ncbi:MAG TPA: DPP IV N-terminal domain-containing protein [Bacteroidales bacterium]|nr:DPP IV N-terminal domain-containing protein [Bacteroidales bacterium]HQB56457.1 DPP IV N-terminal domain-containing protein [Bacteroidales bacterium]
MKRFTVLLITLLLPLFSRSQERIVVETPPDGLVKPLAVPVSWKDNRTLVIRSGGLYLEDIETGERIPAEDPGLKPKTPSPVELEDKALNPVLSPDGKYVAYTLNNDLYAKELSTGKIKRFTFDGSKTILNGYASWVYYEEILGRSGNYRSFWWSPDSRRLAFFRCDDSNVPMFPIYVADGQYGLLEETRYPKAGSENPQVKVGVVSVGEEEGVIWADFDPAADQYFGQPFWSPDGSVLLVQWMNRDQNVLKLYTVDPADGSKKIIYTEEQPAWLEWISDPIFWEKGILMVRDFESWEQVYFCSLDGNLLRRLTDGRNWGISLHGTDPKGDFLFFSARREISTRTDLYRLPLAGAKGKKDLSVQRLTTGAYHNTNVLFSPDYRNFTVLCSNVSTPSRSLLYNVEEGLVRQLGDSRGDAYDLELEKGNVPVSELHFLTTEDGFTIPAIITWPLDMVEGKEYPVLASVYGGPNSGSVTDRWIAPASRYHWARKGVIQITMDHRGSGHCGKRGLDMMHRNLGKWEIHDYKLWIDYLRDLGCADNRRTGITGFSYGGYVTALAVCTAGDYFPYGIAGAGVYDWMFYDTHYTERFMDTPQDNPEGYRNASVLEQCAAYGTFGPSVLLITHGSSDDNVHFQNSMRLVDELMKKNKHFRFMIYPGARHGYRGYQGSFSSAETMAFWTRYLLEE